MTGASLPGPHPVLAKLADELHRRSWPAVLVHPPDCLPYVLAHGGIPSRICERVFASETGGLYIPGVRPQLASARGSVWTAADRLIWILRARARHEYPAEIRSGLIDLTALQQALAQRGHHGEVIAPPPYLRLPVAGGGSAAAVHVRLLQFCWAGLELGYCRHVTAVAGTIAWALDAGAACPPEAPRPPDDGAAW